MKDLNNGAEENFLFPKKSGDSLRIEDEAEEKKAGSQNLLSENQLGIPQQKKSKVMKIKNLMLKIQGKHPIAKCSDKKQWEYSL